LGFLELNKINGVYMTINRLACILLILLFSNDLLAGKLSIEGKYQGKNVFLYNPNDGSGFGFCITKIYVNGDILPASLNSTSVTVNLTALKMAIGEPVFLVIHYGDDCLPKILNPEVLLPKSTFVINSIVASSGGELKWSTSGEAGKLNYIIEQYKWDKWVAVGEVQGEGDAGLNSYSFTLTPHSGKNEVRVSQVDNSLKKRSSKSVLFVSAIGKVSKSPTKVKDFISMKSNGVDVETYYEVFDAYGNILKSGKGAKVDCRKLVNGLYYLNFDNTTEKFIKN
jgi:hypothetical protein